MDVQLAQDSDQNNAYHLISLGDTLLERFNRFGSLEDVESAISSYERAVQLTSDDHPDKPSYICKLGNSFISRFERTGYPDNLARAISSHQKAVQLTPDDHPDKPSYLCDLGNAFRTRFQRLGSLEDMEKAILNQREAVQLTLDGHPRKSNRLFDLGRMLKERFMRLGTLEDLENALSSQQQAIQLLSDTDPDKLGYLSELANMLMMRFERLGTAEDLERAISNLQTAVQFTPDSNPQKPNRLIQLGNAHQKRFDRLKSPEDLDNSFSNHKKAVDLTPDGHPNKPAHLRNLQRALQNRPEHLQNKEDMEVVITGQQRAIQLLPDGHPDKASHLTSLGAMLQMHPMHLNDPYVSTDALSAYKQAATSPTGPPTIRFNAALRWAECAEASSVSPLPAFTCAIDLLSRIAWLGLRVTDQRTMLADSGGVVRDAVAAAIRHQEYEAAIELAEQGRSIMWQNLLNHRMPLDELHVEHPELASRLQTTSQKMDSFPPLENSMERASLFLGWEGMVEEVRSIPKFENFLRPKSFNELAPAARDGPVVILNDHESGNDALVLIPDDSSGIDASVIHIPLEGFNAHNSSKLLSDLEYLLSQSRTPIVPNTDDTDASTCGVTFEGILRELWLHVVKPVIDILGYQDSPETLPRIWWCTTGSLSFLPIHAAGIYGTESTRERLSNYAISSYTPNLTALLNQSQPVITEDFQILTVSEPSDSNSVSRPEKEVRSIKNLAGNLRVASLMEEQATVELTLQELTNSQWIHITSRTYQKLDDPMQSGFTLFGDNVLTLSDIIKVPRPKADFAFLSAGQTAMGDKWVPEQSLHPAAGLLLSGCSGVIASMWPFQDDAALAITEAVYSRILKDGKSNRKEVAFALHEAVKQLRDEDGFDISAWMPFIHVGR